MKPTISVVINTCDRCASLRTTLYALHRQTYPHFEVVVVLGPSRDDSERMLAEEFGDTVTVVRCPRFNLSVSRNLGLRQAAGEVVAFVDDDAVPCNTWLEQLAAAYEDPSVAGAGGRTYHVHPEAGELQFLYGRISALAEQRDVRPEPAAPLVLEAPSHAVFPRFHGTNMSYRREVLCAAGGFDERFEYLFDDADIGVRLGRRGAYLHQLEQATVYHAPGSGRNRRIRTWDLNWYAWMRSTLYFTLKNGPPAAGLARSLAKALRHTLDFYLRVNQLRERGELGPELYPRVRGQLRKALIQGFIQGLLLPRRIPGPGRLKVVSRAFKPFPRPDSARFPAICPRSAERQTPGPIAPLPEPPLRLCLLSCEYPPSRTHGVARSSQTLALGLAELGHEVHVITQGEGRVTYYDGAYVHQVSPRGEHYQSYRDQGLENLYWWLSYSQAVHEQVDVLRRNHRIQLVDSPLWQMDGLVTALAGELPVAVRVVTAMKQIADVHGRRSSENALLAELEEHFLWRCGAVISNSTATEETLRQVYDLDLAATLHQIVPYGMVPAPDDQVHPLPAATPAEPLVLFVGRMEKRKGILDLFTAIPEVLHRFPRARFLIAGSDNSREDGFRAAQGCDYPTYFRRRYPGCAGRVRFLGFVPEEHLGALYDACDLFVAPSLYESFGLIYLEAMNRARPVIACAAGGPRDIVVEGETGLLVPPADPAALALALCRLLADPAGRRAMGLAGRRRLLDRFTHTHMAQGFVALYRQLLAARGSQGEDHG